MPTSFAKLPVINWFSEDSLNNLRMHLRQSSWHIFELEGEYIKDKESFFIKAAEQLPHENDCVALRSWDALVDVLWGGLSIIKETHIAFIWTSADKMLEKSLPDLLVAINCFEQLSSEVATIKYGFPHTMFLKVFLMGKGDNFKTFQAD